MANSNENNTEILSNSKENLEQTMDVDEKKDFRSAETYMGHNKAICLVLSLFLIMGTSLICFYSYFPKLDKVELQYVKIPRNLVDVKHLAKVLDRYKEKYFYHVFVGIFFLYILFAIPGSIFLSILSGFLFPFYLALFMVCLCSGIGASLCYCLSYVVGRSLVYRFCSEQANRLASTIARHHDNMLHYIMFLRITPLLPNWFINIASPIVGVPLQPFFIGTVLGVAPPSFLAIQTGTTLYEISSTTQTMSLTNILLLFIFAVIVLLPIVLRYHLQHWFE